MKDIKEITDIVKPTYGILTAIGPQHLDTFKNLDNVRKTKLELIDSLPDEEGIAFVNWEDENIRNSKFFETTLGSVINSIATIESSHFQVLKGNLELVDGIVNINPITSLGKVLCIHIAGNMNLITNEADMKLRARMGSQFADMLGPLAAVNPVNLIKVLRG